MVANERIAIGAGGRYPKRIWKNGTAWPQAVRITAHVRLRMLRRHSRNSSRENKPEQRSRSAASAAESEVALWRLESASAMLNTKIGIFRPEVFEHHYWISLG